ncbi:prepilin-type N-terminal cleavage/methylation domain-containing protein [Lacisediminihabitans profunda]|uniref:Prepilin-type N-terminal cleavage/methylation domain-containing protein n=1 Tax=Lacisediminihabitans profunda TaxID=2594790 RepID=A0A5C8UQY3_9MICO|nr:prepilin-type N-terminal cleavage/methylation domain-containing protein [Lacisediminihabitans profunda]TXN30307.1 prepilin-type N-terminal cleavage/methylation domain-containing protein [Lacisediminihabitans profunda]
MTQKRGASGGGDAGFTLVELIISMLLSLVVLLIAGGVLVSGLSTQQTVKSVTSAATVAQQIVRSVQSGVRNASAVTVISNTTTGTQLLIARVIGSDPASTASSCQAWYYTPANGGAVYTKRTTPASVITLPSGGPQGVWTLLGVGVSPIAVTGNVFTAPAGSRVDLTFNVAADSHPYVKITTTTYTPQTPTVSSPCF